jgi:nucleoside-diphosphate-sugar epimerase
MILITGWTGTIGRIVVDELRDQHPDMKRTGVSRSAPKENPHSVIIEKVDLNDEKCVRELFSKYKFEIIVHIANIRYSPLLLELANQHKTSHIILIHTTGIYSKYRSYSNLYNGIENKILLGDYPDTNYTILRPTMIYGNSRDYNMHKLIKFLSKFPIFPIFGNGLALMQPTHVEDLAQAIITCLSNEKVKNKSYDLSGGSVITYKDVLKVIASLLEKRVRYIHIPIRLAILLAKISKFIFRKAIVLTEQVKRLQEDKTYSHEQVILDFGYHPRSFKEGIKQEISQLKSKGLIS